MTSQRVKGYHNKNFFCYDRSILSSSIPHYLIVNWAAMHMKLLLKSKITYNANRADRYNAPSNIYNSTAVRHFRYFHFQKKKKTPSKSTRICKGTRNFPSFVFKSIEIVSISVDQLFW